MPAKLDKTDIQLKNAIAKRIKEIRKNVGKTQEEIAYNTNRDKQSLSKNERGKGASIYTIHKFCIQMGITLSEFFNSDLFSSKKGSHKGPKDP